MCPACMASAAMVVAGLLSTSGLTALFRKIRAKVAAKNSIQNASLKEETWAK